MERESLSLSGWQTWSVVIESASCWELCISWPALVPLLFASAVARWSLVRRSGVTGSAAAAGRPARNDTEAEVDR